MLPAQIEDKDEIGSRKQKRLPDFSDIHILNTVNLYSITYPALNLQKKTPKFSKMPSNSSILVLLFIAIKVVDYLPEKHLHAF